jgi:glycosyltransferase
MRFLIVIPCHNEEQNLRFCLQSLAYQEHQDFQIVLVNDGSTDRTRQEIDDFLQTSLIQSKIKVLHLELSEHSPGSKVVNTFNKGLYSVDLQDFDIICKFDADIIFPENYLSLVNDIYIKNPKIGMASGLVKITKIPFAPTKAYDFSQNEDWIFEDISSKNHIRGPIKSYRKECFLQMNGLRAILGWDNIDVLLARKNGWQIYTIKELWVKHLRPTAYQYKNQKAKKLGEYFYNIGLDFPLMLMASLKVFSRNKSISEFLTIVKTYFRQNHEIPLNKQEINFIRKYRRGEILGKVKHVFLKNK